MHYFAILIFDEPTKTTVGGIETTKKVIDIKDQLGVRVCVCALVSVCERECMTNNICHICFSALFVRPYLLFMLNMQCMFFTYSTFYIS